MSRKLGLIIVLKLLFGFASFAQTKPPIEDILLETKIQTIKYQETFQNLLALETKTFESYDPKGQTKTRRTVEADFLLYRSSKKANLSFELRNVKTVDGKPIPKTQAISDKLFAELRKTKTLKSELDKIQKAGSKYDKTLEVSGLTLYEGVILSDNLRPFFEFRLLGNVVFQGQTMYLISYQQIKPSPFIFINRKGADLNSPSLDFSFNIPRELKKNDVFLRGKFWIDPRNFQIWREERELTIQTAEPFVILATSFEYQSSNFGILVPKQISVSTNEIRKKDGAFIAFRDVKINFDYSTFRKFETDVKILDDSEN